MQMRAAMFANIYKSVLYICPILTRVPLTKQFPVKIPRIKLHNIRQTFLEYGRTDGETHGWKTGLVASQGVCEDA